MQDIQNTKRYFLRPPMGRIGIGGIKGAHEKKYLVAARSKRKGRSCRQGRRKL